MDITQVAIQSAREAIEEMNEARMITCPPPDIDVQPEAGPEYLLTSDSAREKAERHGWKVVLPTPFQLFIDIDSEEAMDVYDNNRYVFDNFYTMVDEKITQSKSGLLQKRHIILTLREPVTDMERLLLQAFLGSDLKREFLGLQLIKNGDKTPTLFLEKP